jgi:hypothetical protein
VSRWTIPELGGLSDQEIFDRVAYHILAKGGEPQDILIKPNCLPYMDHRRWGYLVKQGRAPKRAAQLIALLEEVARHTPLDRQAHEIVAIGRAFKLEISP